MHEVVLNLLIALLEAFPVLDFDAVAPLPEPVDDFGVVVGKGDESNLDGFVCILDAVHSVVWHFGESLFNLILDKESELADLRQRTGLVVELFLEDLVHVVLDHKFDGVVSSRHGLHIVVDILVLLDKLDIVHKHHSGHIQEHAKARGE